MKQGKQQNNLKFNTAGHSTNARTATKIAKRSAVSLAFVCLGLLYTIHPFAVQGSKARPQSKGGDSAVQGSRVQAVSSAVVNFRELAKQQALNPDDSEPTPLPITPPRTIEEVDGEKGEAEAPNPFARVDAPGPLIPSPAPANNFAALGDIPFAPPGTAFFTIPPDTMGAVGTDAVNKVFVNLNNNYRVQNKTTGAQIGTDVSMRNFWAPAGATSAFDPRIQYDPYNDRWILAGVTEAATATTSILVGISTTNDPSGTYLIFKVSARIVGDPANLNFADFPMLGFNKNWIVVSINMFTSAGAFSNGRALVIDYPNLRTNGTLVSTYFTGVSAANAGFCMHPATTYSATEATEYLAAHQASAGATYRLHTITGTPAAPVFTIGALKVRPGGGWTQPGGNILPQAMGTCTTTPMRLDVGDSFVRSNVVFRNGTIWYPQTVGLPAGGLTHTAAQWTQLDTAGNVLQGGRVDDPTATATNGGKWYAYPSIAVNATNDVLLGFSQCSSTQFASAGYTYKDHTDAAGTMRDPVIFKAGEDCYSKDFSTGRNRWGDYSHTMVDPSNDCSFWTIQEYAKFQAPPTVGGSTSKWGTWWARVNAISTISAQADIVVGNDPNQCGAIVTYTTPTTGGGCGTITCSPTSGSFFPVGTTTVTCTNTAGGSSSFNVTVNDVQAPTVTCPANITVSNDPGQCGAVVNFVATTADNCPGVSVACTPASGSFFPVGTTTVTCQATDASSNTATCMFTVTVNDTEAPVVTCNVTTTTLWPPDHLLINVGLSVSAADNCPGVTTSVAVFGDENDEEATGDGNHSPDAKDIAAGTLRLRAERKGNGDGRVYLIIVTATDASGNVSRCCRTVTVAQSQSKASVASVAAQAAAARLFCEQNGTAPPGYFVIGDGPIIGPIQ